MGLGIKYFVEDVKHYRDMIQGEENWLASLKESMTRFEGSPLLMGELEDAVERAEDNLSDYRERLAELIQKGRS